MTFWQISLPKRGRKQDAKKKNKEKKEQEEKKPSAVRRYHTFEENFLVLFVYFIVEQKTNERNPNSVFKMLGFHHNTFA